MWCRGLSVSNAWEFITAYQKKQVYQRRFVKAWKDAGVQAVIWPTAGPAFPKGVAKDLICLVAPYAVLSIVDCAVCTLPVTKVLPEEQIYKPKTTGRHIAAQMQQVLNGSAGMPIGVQVATLPFTDELCLRVRRELDAVLKAVKS